MNLYENNILILQEERCKIKKGIPAFAKNYLLVPSKEDSPGLVCVEGENRLTIHSLYYPVKEAEKLVSGFESNHPTIIVFGLGLGYHLKMLVDKYPEKQIILIEPDKNLFKQFLAISDLRDFPGIQFIIGYADYEICTLVNLNKQAFDLFEFKPMVKLFSFHYECLFKRLSNKSIYELSSKFKYKKFQNPQLRVIFIDSAYVLTKECLEGIQQNGHLVKYIHLDKDNYEYDVFIRDMLTTIIEFRPDFIMTINHLGFDQEGRLTELLTELEMPYVSWYVDSPTVILSSFEKNLSSFCNIFVWDKDYINDLKELKYPYVDYLPLATSLSIFRPVTSDFLYDVSFVGSSMMNAIHKNMKSYVHRADLLQLMELTSDHFSSCDSRYVNKSIQALEAQGHKFIFQDQNQRDDFEAAVLWRSTQKYRLSGIKKLSGFKTYVNGDPGWEYLLDESFVLGRELWYYDNLFMYYNQSKINFNMTSKQMKNAVNQRVFDVAACRKFLITDYKTQLDEIFTSKEEYVTFSEIAEIPDLVKYYLKNDQQREIIANKAYQRIQQNGTYKHRIKAMIDILRKRYI